MQFAFRILVVFFLLCSYGVRADDINPLNNVEVNNLSQKYNLSIYTSSFNASSYATRWASWTELSPEDSSDFFPFMQVFYEEWSKYPIEWIKLSKLKGIAFVKNLVVVGQERFAMPDAYNEVLYYDIDYLIYGQRYVRECIHHEFYHMVEENFYGDMYNKDPQWSNMNPDGFVYGDGGYSAYSDAAYANEKHPLPGFVTGYATFGLEEDKAEVYSYLFSSESYADLMIWVVSDSILAAKVRYMKVFLQSKVPMMNDNYFLNIHDLN